MPPKSRKKGRTPKTEPTNFHVLKASLKYRVNLTREDLSILERQKLELVDKKAKMEEELRQLEEDQKTALQEVILQWNEYKVLTKSQLQRSDVIDFMKTNWKMKKEYQAELDDLNCTIADLRAEIQKIRETIEMLKTYKDETFWADREKIQHLRRENELILERTESIIKYLREAHNSFLKELELAAKAKIDNIEKSAIRTAFNAIKKWFIRDLQEQASLKQELDFLVSRENELRDCLSNLQQDNIQLNDIFLRKKILNLIRPIMFAQFELSGNENLKKDQTLNLEFERCFEPTGRYANQQLFNEGCFPVKVTKDRISMNQARRELLDQLDEIQEMKEKACNSTLNDMLRDQYDDSGWNKVFPSSQLDEQLMVLNCSPATLQTPEAPDVAGDELRMRFDPRSVKFPTRDSFLD